MTAVDPTSRAWQEGYDARMRSIVPVNPYVKPAQEATDWEDGWITADAEKESQES